MPDKFEKCRKKAGAKIRTVTKGGNKGRLICIPKGVTPSKHSARRHPVLGNRRGQ